VADGSFYTRTATPWGIYQMQSGVWQPIVSCPATVCTMSALIVNRSGGGDSSIQLETSGTSRGAIHGLNAGGLYFVNGAGTTEWTAWDTNGNFGVGNNTAPTSDPTYFDANGVTHENGTAPTGSAGTVTGTNAGGYISGLSAATSVTLTFANSGFKTWAACNGTASVSLATNVYVSAQSKTACTFTFPSLTGTLYYHVDGN
jgi:hypothetical protein